MSQPPPTSEQPPPARFRRSWPPARGRGPFVLAALLLLAAAGAGWYFVGGARVRFTNELAAPVRLAPDQGGPLTLAPGETLSLPIGRGRALVVLWELVRPLSASGRPMGSEVRGSIVVRAPRGTVRRSARARGPDADYFAPLITNASNDLLRVTVNAGLEGALDCGCAVRPGARRVFIGYYPLFQNSTVRATSGDGRGATFRDLGPSVTAPDGTVGLRFESRDLR